MIAGIPDPLTGIVVILLSVIIFGSGALFFLRSFRKEISSYEESVKLDPSEVAISE
jgi:hypothetical protein